MRKADYSELAAIIRKRVFAADDALRKNESIESFSAAACARQTCAQIAGEFANSASVDKAQFLTACGMADHVRPPGKLYSPHEAKQIAEGAAKCKT